MSEISLPYHLIIPTAIFILFLGIILYKRKKLFRNERWKWFWISLAVFLVTYSFIVGCTTYYHISLQLNLQKFDFNGDGIFTGTERTPALKTALKKVSSDTARNFSFITGLFFSGIMALFVFVIGKTTVYLKKVTRSN